MTLGQHINSIAKAHTIEELWDAFDAAPIRTISRANYMGAIMAKLKTREWGVALASRKQED